jgi:hypothetical protein
MEKTGKINKKNTSFARWRIKSKESKTRALNRKDSNDPEMQSSIGLKTNI